MLWSGLASAPINQPTNTTAHESACIDVFAYSHRHTHSGIYQALPQQTKFCCRSVCDQLHLFSLSAVSWNALQLHSLITTVSPVLVCGVFSTDAIVYEFSSCIRKKKKKNKKKILKISTPNRYLAFKHSPLVVNHNPYRR